jgi:hypothetical protein
MAPSPKGSGKAVARASRARPHSLAKFFGPPDRAHVFFNPADGDPSDRPGSPRGSNHGAAASSPSDEQAVLPRRPDPPPPPPWPSTHAPAFCSARLKQNGRAFKFQTRETNFIGDISPCHEPCWGFLLVPLPKLLPWFLVRVPQEFQRKGNARLFATILLLEARNWE